jgi:hypothetical protein
MNADGSEQTRLTDSHARDEAPCWSPDGTSIAYASERDGNWEIYVMNAEGFPRQRPVDVAVAGVPRPIPRALLWSRGPIPGNDIHRPAASFASTTAAFAQSVPSESPSSLRS